MLLVHVFLTKMNGVAVGGLPPAVAGPMLAELADIHTRLDRVLATAVKGVVSKPHSANDVSGHDASVGAGSPHTPATTRRGGGVGGGVDGPPASTPLPPAVSRVLTRTRRDILHLLHEERLVVLDVVLAAGVPWSALPPTFAALEGSWRQRQGGGGGGSPGQPSWAGQRGAGVEPATPAPAPGPSSHTSASTQQAGWSRGGGSVTTGAATPAPPPVGPQFELAVLGKLRVHLCERLRRCSEVVPRPRFDDSGVEDMDHSVEDAAVEEARVLLLDIAKWVPPSCPLAPLF